MHMRDDKRTTIEPNGANTPRLDPLECGIEGDSDDGLCEKLSRLGNIGPNQGVGQTAAAEVARGILHGLASPAGLKREAALGSRQREPVRLPSTTGIKCGTRLPNHAAQLPSAVSSAAAELMPRS